MKLNNGSQVTARPARKPTVGTPGYFAESNETGAPSHPGQDWFNDVIDEITQAVAAAGVAYDPSKITNLKSAVEALRNASNLNAGTVPLARLPAGTSGGIDAAKLEGKNGDYYRNIANMTGNVPIERLPVSPTQIGQSIDNVLRGGDGGIGKDIDLRGSIYCTGTPEDIYGKGTFFGFAEGFELGVPGMGPEVYGTLFCNGHFYHSSGLNGISRVFVSSYGIYRQSPLTELTWGSWIRSYDSENFSTDGIIRMESEYAIFSSPDRVLNTEYINTTDKYRFVSVSTGIDSAAGISIVVNGDVVGESYVNTALYNSQFVSALVPPSGRYELRSVNAPTNIIKWAEL